MMITGDDGDDDDDDQGHMNVYAWRMHWPLAAHMCMDLGLGACVCVCVYREGGRVIREGVLLCRPARVLSQGQMCGEAHMGQVKVDASGC